MRNKEVSAREGKVNVNASYVWSVRPSSVDEERFSTDKRIPIDSDNRDHELDCADFLIALLSGLYPDNQRLCHWDYSWSAGELKDLHITDNYKMYYDRRFVLDLSEAGDSTDKRVHFLEVDRGTKDMGSVREQFKRYKEFFNNVARHDEMLLVTAQRYRFRTDKARQDEIVKLLADLKFGKRAAVALQRDAKVNPLSKIWMRVDDTTQLMTLADL